MVRRRSAVKMIIAASKAVKRVPHTGCLRTRREIVRRLGRINGPFVVVVGDIRPRRPGASTLEGSLTRGCSVPILTVDIRNVERSSMLGIVHRTLCRFPMLRIGMGLPD